MKNQLQIYRKLIALAVLFIGLYVPPMLAQEQVKQSQQSDQEADETKRRFWLLTDIEGKKNPASNKVQYKELKPKPSSKPPSKPPLKPPSDTVRSEERRVGK